MHLYETTSTVMQNDANITKRHAHYLQNMKLIRLIAVFLLVIGFGIAVGTFKHSIAAAVTSVVFFVLAAAICIPVGSQSSKHVAENYYEDGDGRWTMTTWFENDGIHRIDEEGDEAVYPLNKLVCASRTGNVLILCTDTQAVLTVNLVQLKETDRKLLFDRIKAECPRLRMLQTK